MSDLANVDVFDGGEGIVVARIAGDLDLSNLHSVHNALLEMLPNEAFGLVVDLAAVDFQVRPGEGHDGSVALGDVASGKRQGHGCS